MKQNIILLLITVLITSTSCSAQNKQSETTNNDVIEVYYFHFTRRCATCNAVEDETKKAIQELYPELYKTGKITFSSINLDEEGTAELAQKCGADGQSLLIISGDSKTDLTSQGFMYALTSPGKLKDEIKKTIDALL